MFHSYVNVYQRVNLELVKNAEFTHENGEQWRFTHEIYTSREFTNRFNGQVTYVNMGIFQQALFEPYLFAENLEDVPSCQP